MSFSIENLYEIRNVVFRENYVSITIPRLLHISQESRRQVNVIDELLLLLRQNFGSRAS